MNNKSNSNEIVVQSIQRAARIIKCFDVNNSNLSLKEISETCQLPKSTTHRILYTLEVEGLVQQDKDTGKYSLGYIFIGLGNIVTEQLDLRKAALNDMKWLVDKTNQTSNLYILRDYQRVCIEQVTGHNYIRRYSYIGAVFPLYVGATGKIFLADMTPEQLDNYFEFIRQQGIDINEMRLKEELVEIRKRGYSISVRERDQNTASVAAPIYDVNNRAIASVTVSGAASEFNKENMQRYIELVKQAAASITDKVKEVSLY